MKPEADKTYEISCEYFDSFRVKIRKGKVIWCSDRSIPEGSDWKSLRESYENKVNYKMNINEIKKDETA